MLYYCCGSVQRIDCVVYPFVTCYAFLSSWFIHILHSTEVWYFAPCVWNRIVKLENWILWFVKRRVCGHDIIIIIINHSIHIHYPPNLWFAQTYKFQCNFFQSVSYVFILRWSNSKPQVKYASSEMVEMNWLESKMLSSFGLQHHGTTGPF